MTKILILLTIISSVAAHAQTPPREHVPLLRIGIGVGYSLMDHRTSGVACQDGCPQYNGGFGNALIFGASVDWNALDVGGLSLGARYLISALALTAVTSGPDTKNSAGVPVPLERTHTLDVKIQETIIELSAWRTFGRWRVAAGPAIALFNSPTWESTAHIVAPSGATYQNNKVDTTFFPRQPIDGVRASQFLLNAGVSYTMTLSKRFALSPELRATYTLTSFRTVNDWKEFAFELGAVLRFGFDVGEKIPASEPGGGS